MGNNENKQRRVAKKRKGFMKKKVDVDNVNDSLNNPVNNPSNTSAENVNIEQGQYDINTDSFETTASTTPFTPPSMPKAQVSSLLSPPTIMNEITHSPCKHRILSPRKASANLKYRTIMNRSREKLKCSVFKSKYRGKTRLQCERYGLHKQGKKLQPAKNYKLIDAELLSSCISKIAICSKCKHSKSSLILKEKSDRRCGLAETLVFECNNCKKSFSFQTSKKVSSGRSMNDVNIRSVYSAQTIGLAGLTKLCATMDLPAPVGKTSYNKILSALRQEDAHRIQTAESKISVKHRAARRKRRGLRKSKNDPVNVTYYPGAFGLSVEPEIDFQVKNKKRKLLQSTPKTKLAHVNPITSKECVIPMEPTVGDNGFIDEKDIIVFYNEQ